MSVKYIELDTSKSQNIFKKLVKKGYKSDYTFTDKITAENHIKNLYESNKDVIVVVENKTIRWHIFSKNESRQEGFY